MTSTWLLHWFLILSLSLGQAFASTIPCQMATDTNQFDQSITVSSTANTISNSHKTPCSMGTDDRSFSHCPHCLTTMDNENGMSIFDCFEQDSKPVYAFDDHKKIDLYNSAFIIRESTWYRDTTQSVNEYKTGPPISPIYLLTQRFRI